MLNIRSRDDDAPAAGAEPSSRSGSTVMGIDELMLYNAVIGAN
jgi:hypothetical protein